MRRSTILSLFLIAISVCSLQSCSHAPPAKGGSDDYDVIVIGAGMGGLSAGAHLAVGGMSVMLLEQHHKVGGCTSSFSRGEYNFDAALHQMVGVDELQKAAGIDDRIELIRVPDLYRTIFPGVDFTYPGDIDEAVRALSLEWPEESEAIEEFHRLMGQLAREGLELADLGRANPIAKIFRMIQVPFRQPAIFKYRNANLQEVLDEHFEDEGLKAVISQLWVYYGPPPSRLWAPIFMIANYHYLTLGGWQIKGSSQALSDAYAERITELGGRVKTGTRVTSIIVEDGRARGVRTDLGETFRSRYVISNADPYQTFFTLVGEDRTPRKYCEKIRSLKPGNSIFGVYLGLDVESGFWNVDDYEIFYSKSLDADELYSRMMEGDFENGCAAMTFYTNIGDSWYAPPGKSVLVMHAYSDAKFWPRDREEYRRKKELCADRLIALAENLFPGLADHIVVKEVITPLSLEAFTLQKDGIPYGWRLTPEQAMKRLQIETPIEGLYLAGSWSQPSHGVSAAQESGYMAARMVLEEEGIP